MTPVTQNLGIETADRAVLVGVELKGTETTWTIDDSLDELSRLATTAGLVVAGATRQKLAHPDGRTWVGSGKVTEIRELVAAENARYVLFDDELSPGQQKNLQEAMGDGIQVIDRTRLILDIFSQHARSREGKMQVELAQYQYLLPGSPECGRDSHSRWVDQGQGRSAFGALERRNWSWTVGRPAGGSPSCDAAWRRCAVSAVSIGRAGSARVFPSLPSSGTRTRGRARS